MANALTGDFDVVAQFGIPAANRVLAAMHRTERFPHSVASRIDDIERPDLGVRPVIVGAVDVNGEPISNQQHIGQPTGIVDASASESSTFLRLDPVVNLDGLLLEETPIVPSNFQGRAQLQLFPATIEVPDNSGTNIAIRMGLLARYFPDPNTSPVAEFVRGELTITAPVNQVASQTANVVEIDIKGANIGIGFSPSWSSRTLQAEDLLGINRLIRNAMRTSFLPSSSPLPSSISHMQFRTLQGPTQAVAVLLNMGASTGNRASASNVFLGADDYAFAVSADYVHSAFQPTLDKILSTPLPAITFKFDTWVHTWTITYTFALNNASFALEEGQIVLTIQGHAYTSSWTPKFDFTARLSFALSVNGDNVDLVGSDVSIDTSSWIINQFRGSAESAIRNARDDALDQSGARAAIRNMLSAERNLGGLIDSLLQPPRQGSTPPLPRGFGLAYTSADIHTSGIVLHGALSLTPWPVPHVEFERIPVERGDSPVAEANALNLGPDYSALKTWIPGGRIDRYEWKALGQTQPGFMDANRFVFLGQGPSVEAARAMDAGPVAGFTPLCVTVHGTRLSASGPIVSQAVSGTICGIHRFPFPPGAEIGGLLIALTQPSGDGGIVVGGQTAAGSATAGRRAPNLVVHFGDRGSGVALKSIIDAMLESGRTDASTAVLAVLSHEELSHVRYTPGVTYADDAKGAWASRFGVKVTDGKALTLIVSPDGKVLYQQDDVIDRVKFADQLRKTLVRGGRIASTLAPTSVRIGQLPPNFLFEYSKGHSVTLRKVTGRPVTVVFWRSSSQQSIDVLREVTSNGKRANLVLAVSDGEPADDARRVFVQNKLHGVFVSDPRRQISLAYGIDTWPTIVEIDSLGLARSILLGSFPAAPMNSKGRDAS